jgi:signal transduction histidine kinase
MRRLLPRPTLRLRLTVLYGGLFLIAGTALLAITYGLVAHSPAVEGNTLVFARPNAIPVKVPQPVFGPAGPGAGAEVRSGGPLPANATFGVQAYAGRVKETLRKLTAAQQAQLQRFAGRAQVALHQQQHSQLDALLTRSGIALGIMAVLSIGLGWVMAGRALRPVRTMSVRARGISERNLHERLSLDGPDDELKELADTFDELLARLESAFESQRQFVANASHELRTPITLERTLVEVALADPASDAESLRGTCRRVLAAGEQQERMIEALLTLARSQRGLGSRKQVALDSVAADALQGVRPDGVRVETELEPAATSGDPALVERLLGNLLENALRYNLPSSGWVSVSTGEVDGVPTLRVANSGAVITDEQAAQLTEPFHRLNGNRIGTRGAGLGLSIVAAIATAHDAELQVDPRPDGGLDVEVRFPALVPAVAA